MEQILKLLNNCWLNYLHQHDQKHIYCLSAIQGEKPGWYIWFYNYPGVYELQLLRWATAEETEKSVFVLRYYPDLEDEAFDRLSCKEQITRLSKYFDNNLIAQKSGEGCPCSQLLGKQEQQQQYVKGIPRCFYRKRINPDLFTIAQVEFTMVDQMLKEITLVSQDYLRLYSTTGIKVGEVELVAAGELDRDFLGWTVSWYFVDVLVKQVLGKLGYYSKDCHREIEQGVVYFEDQNGVLWEERDPGVTCITHKFYF